MMSEQSSITHFFDVFNNRDLDKLGDLLTENAEFYFPKTQPLLGKKQIIRFFNILFRQYPELEFKIQRKIIQGEIGQIAGPVKEGSLMRTKGLPSLKWKETRSDL
jgi:ketosteroid isomerase-like protein